MALAPLEGDTSAAFTMERFSVDELKGRPAYVTIYRKWCPKRLCEQKRQRFSQFNPEETKFENGVVVDLPYPTDDVRLLTKTAVDALERVYRPGFNYSKAEFCC
ncbi:hypothetical protein QF010_001506 [Pseudomonas silensiensis]